MPIHLNVTEHFLSYIGTATLISSSFPVLPTQRYGYLVKLEGWGDVSHKSYLDVYVCIVPLNRQRIVAGGAADPGQ